MLNKNGKPQCDMVNGCLCPVKYIDIRGFIYCEFHGLQRKRHERCRKLKPTEIKTLERGEPLERY